MGTMVGPQVLGGRQAELAHRGLDRVIGPADPPLAFELEEGLDERGAHLQSGAIAIGYRRHEIDGAGETPGRLLGEEKDPLTCLMRPDPASRNMSPWAKLSATPLPSDRTKTMTGLVRGHLGRNEMPSTITSSCRSNAYRVGLGLRWTFMRRPPIRWTREPGVIRSHRTRRRQRDPDQTDQGAKAARAEADSGL